MAVAAKLTLAIKRALKVRGHTYAWLAHELGVSESTIKRLLSRGQMSLERFDAMCVALRLEVADLLKLASTPTDTVRELTLQQEQVLADHPKALAVFYMLLNGWSSERAAKECRLSSSELIRILTRLDRINVLELLPRNRVRLLVPKDHLWRPNGPLRTRYRQEALQEFFTSTFSDPEQYLRFEIGLLSGAGVDQLKRRIDRVTREFNELADLDAGLPQGIGKKPVAVLVAFRPWDVMWILRQAEMRTSSAKPG